MTGQFTTWSFVYTDCHDQLLLGFADGMYEWETYNRFMYNNEGVSVISFKSEKRLLADYEKDDLRNDFTYRTPII